MKRIYKVRVGIFDVITRTTYYNVMEVVAKSHRQAVGFALERERQAGQALHEAAGPDRPGWL